MNILKIEKIRGKLKGNLGIFLYKIGNDILFLLLFSLAMLLVSEGMMPGLITAYLSFTRLILIIFAVLGFLIYLGKINGITFEMENKKSVLIFGLVSLSVLLIINSSLKFNWLENGIITASSIILLFYLYKNFSK